MIENIVLVLLLTVSISVTSLRLLRLGEYERRWRALVPGWNLLVLGDMLGITRETWFLPVILYVFLGPFVIVLVILWPLLYLIPFLTFMSLGYQLAERTDRPPWVGLLLSLPGVQLFGWPTLALTAFNGDGLELEGRKGRRRPKPPSVDAGSPEARLQAIEELRQVGTITREEANRRRRAVLDEATGRSAELESAGRRPAS